MFKRPFLRPLFILLAINTAIISKVNAAEVQPEENLATNAPGAASSLMFEDTLQKPEEPGTAALIKPLGLLRYQNKDFIFDMTLRFRPEAFYSKNVGFFSGSDLDQVFYVQQTTDIKMRAAKSNYIRMEATIRNKYRWGVQNLFNTVDASVLVNDVPTFPHSHGISRQLVWLREMYIDFSVNKALDALIDREHNFVIGSFPYMLGRGIAYGDAYASSPGVLGFFADNAIDQFPPAALLHGEIDRKGVFHYDAYFALLQNFSDSFSSVSANIYSNRVKDFNSSYRGFGDLNFVLAGRITGDFLRKDVDGANATSEMYILYNRAPEQTLEFNADAFSNLGTVGFAFDYSDPCIEFGGEAAFNFGQQNVFGWDRNQIKFARQTTTGLLAQTFTDVYTVQGSSSSKAPVTDEILNIVANAPRGGQFNNQLIGVTSGGITLYNSPTRFSPAYVNKYTGMMAVFDAAYYISGRNLRAVATLGFASGDENPNYDVNFFGESNVDGTYGGFIPLQEIYAGKRVRSFYVIGSKPINRLLSSPVPNAGGAGRQTKFAQRVGGFTNLVFTGGGLQWTPVDSKRRWEVRPNVLFYWVDQPSRVFTLANNLTVSDYLSIPVTDGLNALPTDFGSLGTKFARKFLGTEANLFVDFVMLDQLKFYFVSAVFMPGDYYRDVFGTPLNNADLDNLIAIRNNAGETFGTLPLLGTSTAFSVNAGLQYEF